MPSLQRQPEQESGGAAKPNFTPLPQVGKQRLQFTQAQKDHFKREGVGHFDETEDRFKIVGETTRETLSVVAGKGIELLTKRLKKDPQVLWEGVKDIIGTQKAEAMTQISGHDATAKKQESKPASKPTAPVESIFQQLKRETGRFGQEAEFQVLAKQAPKPPEKKPEQPDAKEKKKQQEIALVWQKLNQLRQQRDSQPMMQAMAETGISTTQEINEAKGHNSNYAAEHTNNKASAHAVVAFRIAQIKDTHNGMENKLKTGNKSLRESEKVATGVLTTAIKGGETTTAINPG